VLELDNVLMIHRLEQLSFLFEQLHALFLESLALDDLDCDLLIGFLINGPVDCAEGALAEHALKLVMI